jgi:biopolymer transport protein ExbB/TolQ
MAAPRHWKKALMRVWRRTATEAPHSDDLERKIMKRLEWLRIVARTAPMLGW